MFICICIGWIIVYCCWNTMIDKYIWNKIMHIELIAFIKKLAMHNSISHGFKTSWRNTKILYAFFCIFFCFRWWNGIQFQQIFTNTCIIICSYCLTISKTITKPYYIECGFKLIKHIALWSCIHKIITLIA